MKLSTPLTEGNQLAVTNQKYQKAIKEINKLILINRETKRELITLQEQYNSLEQENIHLKEKCSTLEGEHPLLPEPQDELKMGRPAFSFESASQALENSAEKNVPSTQKRRKESYSPALSIPNKELENTGTISEYIDNKRKLEETEEKLLEKDEKIKEMMRQIVDKNNENTQLYEKQIELMNQNTMLKKEQEVQKQKNEQIEILEHQTKILEEELQKSKESIRQLTANLLESKKTPSTTFIQLKESLDSKMTNTKSLNLIPELINLEARTSPLAVSFQPSYYSAQQTSRIGEKEKLNPFSSYYLQKIKDLESEIFKGKKMMEEKRVNYKQQISVLKTELKEKTNSMLKMNSLLTKQQEYIEQYIHTHQSPSVELLNDSVINPPVPKLKVNSRNSIEKQSNPAQSHRNIPSILQGTRINTIQSEEYTLSLSEVHKTNYGAKECKLEFVEGTRYYNK